MIIESTCSCGAKLIAGKPVYLRCSACGKTSPVGNPKSRGFGDTIHKITTALHIPHCGGCEQRRELLNQIVPYRKS